MACVNKTANTVSRDMEDPASTLIDKSGEKGEKKHLSRQKSDLNRATDFITSLKDMPDDSPFKKGVRCFFKWGVKPLLIVALIYVWIGRQIYKIYKMLPINLVRIVFGIGYCFFGGVYFTAIAAIEAAINLGGADMFKHLQTCWNEAAVVATASMEDDQVDANADGIADVQQMNTNELINHKAFISMKAVKDPKLLQDALFSLGNTYIAVIATLKFQFARTVAISLGIANMLTLPITRLTGPFLAGVMGPDLNHWVPTIIDTTIKIIAVFVATYIQAFISAFYSGLKGGRMIATAIFNILGEHGILDKFPDSLVQKPFDPEVSCLDEVIAYPIAAFGFYMQVTRGFTLDFPWNLICGPLTLVEWILRWQVYTA